MYAYVLANFNATPGSPRFNEICDMLHVDILPDNTHMLMMVLLAKHVHGWYSRHEHFENVNNLSLKSLLCDSTPIDKLMAYLQSIGVFSQI